MSFKCWELDIYTDLDDVFKWCIKEHNVDRLLVTAVVEKTRIKRHSIPREMDDRVRSIFGKNLMDSFFAKGWTGTELIDHVGRVYLINFNEEVKNSMIKVEKKIFNWTHHNSIPLPEDICLFRHTDRFPILVSVTHEKEAWIITEKKMSLKSAQITDFTMDDLFIFSDKHFCKI